MNFDTQYFLALLLVTIVVQRVLPSDRLRQLLLLVLSYLFYASWDWHLLGLVLLVTAISYYGGLRIETNRRADHGGHLISLFVALLLLPLAVFKYFDFFSLSVTRFSAFLGLDAHMVVLDLVLPIGISFYSFHAISYVADVHAGRLPAERNFLRYGLYICFFPQLIAGPIVRSTDFLPQLNRPWVAPDAREMAGHLCRFLWGMAKKLLIADRLAVAIVNPAFANPATIDAQGAALGALAFTLMIYADFSAYSDMAISSAGMMGYRFKENFQAPYMATSIQDFWRRWHISLSSWIRDYVYIPMGGNRVHGRFGRLTTLLASMLLCGLWHGAAWTYVLWGLWHGVALAVERLWLSDAIPSMATRVGGRLFTMAVVIIGWIVFRAGDLAQAAAFLDAFFESGRTHMPFQAALVMFLALSAAVVIAEHMVIGYLARRGAISLPVAACGAMARVLVACLLAVAIMGTMNSHLGERNFIYFQF